MKKFCYYLIPALLIVSGVISVSIHAQNKKAEAKKISSARASTQQKNVVAYITSTFNDMPDPTVMTHIYYAFGNVSETYDSVVIMNMEKFKKIVDLKEENPDLKISLSLQTIPRDGFAKMSASDSLRKAFVNTCKTLVDTYNLDGIDLDWEFPGTNAGMHQGGAPDDPLHYSWLARDLKKALGPEKTLSFYSSNSARYNDFKLMEPYVDYVMVSGYNLGTPPSQHQSNLYPSATCGNWSVSESVKSHIAQGVPREKIMIGVPFYARTQKDYHRDGLKDNYVAWRQFERFLPGFRMRWDNRAKAPYYSDSQGRILAAFDNERSIAEKSRYIDEQGLAGMFYWHYDAETSPNPLANAIKKNLIDKK